MFKHLKNVLKPFRWGLLNGSKDIQIFLLKTFDKCFRDKCVSVFYTEIQDGRQNCRKIIFTQKVDDWVYPVDQKFQGNCSILHRFSEKCVVAFYSEIQDCCKIWQKNFFW